MIEGYLNEQVVYERYTAEIDDYGKPVYDAPVTLACRSQGKSVVVETPKGNILKLTTEYYTKESIRVGDKLAGRIVEGSDEWRDLGGKVVGAKSWV
jgi:uncharacterized phage protein gp47/JayE